MVLVPKRITLVVQVTKVGRDLMTLGHPQAIGVGRHERSSDKRGLFPFIDGRQPIASAHFLT